MTAADAPALRDDSAVIRVTRPVKARLVELAAEQRAERGRMVTVSEVIEQLLEHLDRTS